MFFDDDKKDSYIFTSESVSEGHPDKLCDQVSDAILDAYIKKDKYARVAVEALATTNKIVLAGEVSSANPLSNEQIEGNIRNIIKNIGYEQDGFHWETVDIQNLIHKQSADIAMGVDEADGKEEGAGDQGIMFGFACNETDEYMPATIHYSNHILQALSDARHSGNAPELEPDAKGQVTLKYVGGKPVKATSVVVSTQHKAGLSQADVKEIVRPYVERILPDGWMCPDEDFFVNPTGSFVIGGPDGDAGVTGRKIIVDTYGGVAPHGGGAFSGKDATKVDRSAAYMARYLAKNVVAAGLSDRCTIQIAYAIGVSRPLSFYLNLHTSKPRVDMRKLAIALQDMVDLSPRGIREYLGLNKPIYLPTAAYGHFGRTPTAEGHFSWERLDLVDELKGML